MHSLRLLGIQHAVPRYVLMWTFRPQVAPTTKSLDDFPRDVCRWDSSSCCRLVLAGSVVGFAFCSYLTMLVDPDRRRTGPMLAMLAKPPCLSVHQTTSVRTIQAHDGRPTTDRRIFSCCYWCCRRRLCFRNDDAAVHSETRENDGDVDASCCDYLRHCQPTRSVERFCAVA